jgi:hypothetical protein
MSIAAAGKFLPVSTNNEHDRRAFGLVRSRNNSPNECFASKNGELLWLREASRTAGGEHDRAYFHRIPTRPLRWRSLPWHEY